LCCGDTERRSRSILLLRDETEDISRKTSLCIHEFVEKIEGFEPYCYIMRKTSDGQCVFLKDGSCTIYETRPLICRFYPFQLRNVKDDEYAFGCSNECPGIGRGPQLSRVYFRQLFNKFIQTMKKDAEAET